MDRSPRNRQLSQATYDLLLASARQRRATRQARRSLDRAFAKAWQLIEQIRQEDRDAMSLK